MRTLETLSRLYRLTDILAFFGIAPEPGVVTDHGREILARWAGEVAGIDAAHPALGETERLARYEAALRRAIDLAPRRSRAAERGWRVIDGGMF